MGQKMEGIKSTHWIIRRRNEFGSDIDGFVIRDKSILFDGPFFQYSISQAKLCRRLRIENAKICGIEFVNFKRLSPNWFEKIFKRYEKGIKFYYELGGN